MKYLAYFQAYTNTYGELDVLKQKYEEALQASDVVGLVIGTRPDCMPDELLNYLEELNKQTFLLVEYGIESTDDKVLGRINRGHTFACSADAVRRTVARGILTGAHLIIGLPGQERNEVAVEAKRLSELPLDTLKLHQLQLIRGTRMAREYAARPDDFHLYTPDEYAEVVADFLQNLRPGITVERFVSQSPPDLLAVPGWGLKNHEFTERVKRKLRERDTWQGKYYTETNSKQYN